MPPWPLIEVAIEPKSASDLDVVKAALFELAAEDPHLSVSADRESGQIQLGGTSELQLDAAVTRLAEHIQLPAGAPMVAYREKLGRTATIDYTHKKQTGGSGQFARVRIEFEPGEPGSGFKFENKIVGGAIPKEFIPGVEKGLNMAKENGLLAGFPVIDVTARLVDGGIHDVDSNVLTFQIAAQAAFRELKEKGDARLFEPVMAVEVTSPDEYVGSVIRDLNLRRGMIQGQDMRGDTTIINAMVPLANMFGYVNTLRSFTQGRASYSMDYSHYQEVPRYPDDPPQFPPAVGMRA